ncbi:hypothetical protein [Actinoplanes awajinensis]|uniref:hypothetical protein n=1 Tax=Actinoplanes awajinensis TaxID=135946 RepID=UPI000A5E952F|nr:hypothetical protein [Actinoplanes awajinensis]
MRTFVRYGVALAVVLTLGPAACGKTGGPEPSAAELAQANQHNRCMRSAGVDVPDMDDVDEAGGFTLNTKDPKTLAALSACARLAPPGHREGDPDPAVEEHALRLAECLRRHGIRAEDPEAGGDPAVHLAEGATYPQQQLVDAFTVCDKDVPR